MRAALTISLVGHAIAIAAGVIALPSTPPTLPHSAGEALPVELVALADITDLALGIDLGIVRPDPTPAPAPEVAPVAAATPTPTPVTAPRVVTAPPAPAPVAVAALTPPTAAVTEPGPAPAPTRAPTPAPEPAPAPTALSPTLAALPRPKPNRATATPTPEPTPPAPEPMPVEPPVAAAALAPAPDPIAAIVAATPPAPIPEATPLDREARLGVEGGAANAAMTQTEIDALMQSVYGCYSPPGGYTDPAEVLVVLQFRLNRDGTILGAPQVLQAPAGRYAQAAPESAIRAVLRCAPYRLPPEKYEAWQEVRMRFFPIDMVPR